MTGTSPGPDPSYRALLEVPWLPRIILSMQIARIAQSMVSIALVLFTLAEYDSPPLAGLVTLASILPGLVVSPIAGALLDRHGRMRLVRLDYLVALVALALIAILSLADALPPAVLVLIAAVSSLTSILSVTGVRSLFPIIVPKPLWERVNAVDSNGYVIATIVGPPLAASLVTIVGGATALLVTAVAFGIAAVAMLGIPDPETEVETSGNLLRDAADGLSYAWRNPTIRGLAFSISSLNIAGGITTIAIPLIVISRLGLPEAIVGVIFAVSGIAGMGSALAFGRMDTRGREWRLLVVPMLAVAPAVALLLVPAAVDGIDPVAGVALLAGWAIIIGVANGPLDIALFTIRQRRTDPAWMGRAFAVSMAFNFFGYPIGAAVGGLLADVSLPLAIVPAIGASILGVVFAAALVPQADMSGQRSGAAAPD
ncbi:MAG TPA: MFS transporter [Candidatus Limnocylindrales bacterium]|nr:MFS transporter [Candidatus Limnocylindrales bacterium]